MFGRPDDVPGGSARSTATPVRGTRSSTATSAAVDWPASAFWKPISEAYPDAVILLSSRSSADAWYTSATDTIFEIMRRGPARRRRWDRMVTGMLGQFSPDLTTRAAESGVRAHNADVRATAAPERLVDWHPGDGWEPICTALDVPVPDAAFPHVNTPTSPVGMVVQGPPAVVIRARCGAGGPSLGWPGWVPST